MGKITNFDELIKVFDLLKIEYEVKQCDRSTADYDGSLSYNKTITIDNGIGFYNFFTEFYFLDDVFQGHGVWE